MPIPVKLSEIVDEMSMQGDEASTYLNRVTGELVRSRKSPATGYKPKGFPLSSKPRTLDRECNSTRPTALAD
jgi:hypothetical protein